MYFSKKRILILFLSLSFIFSAQAQEEDSIKVKKPYSSSTSFSLLMTKGNTKEFSLGFDTEHNLLLGKNQFLLRGSIIYSLSDGTKETELYLTSFQYKRHLSSKAHFFGIGRYERNVFSGYNYRFALSAGAGYFWKNTEMLILSSEIAFGWSFEDNIEKTGIKELLQSFTSCSFSSSVKIKVSATSEFSSQEMFFFNLEKAKDYRISSLTSLSVNISRYFALKISYLLRYSHYPVPGYTSSDHYILSSMVINL